jgi:cobalt-precorrin 5A hydrolase
LAKQVAGYIDAVPVISTGSEASLRITPRNLVLGIGCKRGTASQNIKEAVKEVFKRQGLSSLRIQRICTVDIKQNEQGLLGFAEDYGLPLSFFSPQELNALEGDFSTSDFVRETTGTDNVCERAAIAGCDTGLTGYGMRRKGTLLVQKTALDGVTVAVAIRGDPCIDLWS